MTSRLFRSFQPLAGDSYLIKSALLRGWVRAAALDGRCCEQLWTPDELSQPSKRSDRTSRAARLFRKLY